MERAIAKQIKLLPADAIDIIRALRPYKEGNDLLWSINELNRGDKHRPKLLPILTNSSWQMGFMAVEKGGMMLIMDDRRGGHLTVAQADGKPYVPAKKRHPYAEGEVENRYLCAGHEVSHRDAKPLCQIAFGDIEAIKSEPVVAVLHQMRGVSESILLTFERRFFRELEITSSPGANAADRVRGGRVSRWRRNERRSRLLALRRMAYAKLN